MSTSPVNVGIIGCGNISGAYLKACKLFKILDVVALADLEAERAEAKAKEYGVPRTRSAEELLADADIELVINLTVPQVHAEVSQAILEAGKNVYSEKPLAITYADGEHLLDLACTRHLRLGCAPDTFLGGGLQTCRKVIDEGWIGQPVAAAAFMVGHGPESWHPNPAFFYQPGAGPLFDVGPYYLTALVNLLGPLRRVAGSAITPQESRPITSQPLFGEHLAVETPTHISGLLEFSGGQSATLITSFDVWASELPRLEIYGTEGTLSAPDPNTFGGPVRLRRAGADAWSELPLTHGYTGNSRGLGAADMASAMRSGRPQRASGKLALHVLEAMEKILRSAEEGCYLDLASTCERPAPCPWGCSRASSILKEASMSPTPLPLALQLYTLRELPQRLDDKLAQVAAAGYGGVETVGNHGLDAQSMQKLLEQHQPKVVSSHVGLDALENDLQGVIAFNQAVSNDTLVVPWLPPERRGESAASWQALGRALGELGRRCRQAGMHLLYHNHDFEMVEIAGKLALDWLLAGADPEDLGLEPDIAWMVRGGQDPLTLLERYAGRGPRIHVKDIAPAGENLDEDSWADVGYGTLDWPRLLAAAEAAGAQWYIVEHDKPKEPLVSIRRSAEYLLTQ